MAFSWRLSQRLGERINLAPAPLRVGRAFLRVGNRLGVVAICHRSPGEDPMAATRRKAARKPAAKRKTAGKRELTEST
jgi:hypothetical protein